jgi:predicted dehydrogenase
MAASIVPGRQAGQLSDVDDEIHVAIVATANHLHFRLAKQSVSRGADVLIEKPFVIWPEEGRALIQSARAASRLIAINQTRRFYPVARELRNRIQRGDFGPLQSIVHKEGGKLTWPYESGAAFAQGAQRTGVIMDIGVHVIDFYHYLLRPEWTFVSAIHDGFNGPEGLADIELRADNASVSIRLSRYFAQENLARLVFERADISFNVYDSKTYSIRSDTMKAGHFSAPGGSTDYRSYAEPLLLNFLAARDNREPAVCDAESSLPVIDILDEIYRRARQYPAALGNV